MEDQKHRNPERQTEEAPTKVTYELDFESAQEFTRDAMERRYSYFLD